MGYKQRPLFILGNPRSGTTLLRLMLSSHSAIVIAPESSFIAWWYEKYKDWSKASNVSKIDSFVDDLMTSKKIEFWGLNRDKLKSRIIKVNPATYSEICQQVYLEYAEMIMLNYIYWGDKNNYYVTCPDLLLKLYPNAYFIHIIRNVKDVYCSYKELNKISSNSKYIPVLPNSKEEIADDWNNNNNRVLDCLNNKQTKFISIRYEDIVLKPKFTLSQICDLLLLNYEEGMLHYNKEINNKNFEPSEYSSWKSLNNTELTSKRINRHEKLMTNTEKEFFSNACKELLTKYNY